ncbi:fasciclin domain-containing protein [Nitriliruptoraceae bacterium ZYF776]|nr:fasciclin domain-containing protein [Profundirhabdus halotolerans]
MRSLIRTTRVPAALLAGAMLLAACGGDDATDDTPTETADDGAMDDGAMDDGMDDGAMDDGMDDGAMDDGMDDGADGEAMALPTGEFGPACDQIPEDGPGSSEGMAEDPAATAASNNPVLSTLVDLVGEAGLVDTINNAEGITIFAPANSAFEDLQAEDPELFETVASDVELLTGVLTYHVVGEELDAQGLADAGSAATLFEQDLSFDVDGETVTVEAAGSEATVVCGNVATANATVHIIDTVLIPDVG